MHRLLFHTAVVQVWRNETGCLGESECFGERSTDIARPWQRGDSNASDDLAALLTQKTPARFLYFRDARAKTFLRYSGTLRPCATPA